MAMPKGLSVRERDIALFNYLFLNKVASGQQVKRDIFKDLCHQVVYRRLSKLVRYGYLEKIVDPDIYPMLAFSLSKKAFNKYIIQGDSDAIRKQLKSNHIVHDLTLVDIREKIESCKMVTNYFTENLLQSKADCLGAYPLKDIIQIRSDAGLGVRNQGKTYCIALEYEANIKYKNRYRRLLTNYSKSEDIELVLFIGKNSGILKSIYAMEQKCGYQKYGKMFYSSLDDVLKSEGQMTFTNGQGDSFTLL